LAHGSSVGNASLKLLGNALSDKLGVQFRLPHFVNVDVHLRVLVLLDNELLQFLGQLIDALAATADNSAGACRVQRYANAIGCALDVHPADIAHAEPCSDELSDGVVAGKKISVSLLVRKPVAIRIADDTESKTDRMYFLTQ
jgi:hypothetical protein